MNCYRGRPVRGAVWGLLAGIFGAVDLAFGGVVHTDSAVLSILPLAGLIVGLLLGLWAQLGRAPTPAAPGTPPDVSAFTGTPPPLPPTLSGPTTENPKPMNEES